MFTLQLENFFCCWIVIVPQLQGPCVSEGWCW